MRSKINNSLGKLSSHLKIKPLNKQLFLEDKNKLESVSVSIALKKNQKWEDQSNDIAINISNYFYSMYRIRKNKWEYFPLICMETEEDNSIVREINDYIIDKFVDMGIVSPVLALPRLAHTGIEAIMSHPKSVFNIAIICTNAHGGSLGELEVENKITIDDASYVYGIANVVRMAIGGSPSVIFEVKNRDDLDYVKKTIIKALDFLREKIDSK